MTLSGMRLCILAMLQLAELRQKLKELHSAASVDHLAKVDLESQQYRLQDDTSRLEKRLAAAEADRESLGHQLKVGAQQPLLCGFPDH